MFLLLCDYSKMMGEKETPWVGDPQGAEQSSPHP